MANLLQRYRYLEDTEYLLHIPEDWFVLYYTGCPQEENLASHAGSLIRQKLLHVLRGWRLGLRGR